jgi:hypothetical protein
MNLSSLFLFGLVVFLQVVDAYLTWRVLGAGGRELNPVPRALIGQVGLLPGRLLAKVALAVITGVFLLKQPRAKGDTA